MRPTYKYGLITGLISCVFSTSFFSAVNSLNTNNLWGLRPDNIRGIGGLLTILILGIGIYVSMRNARNTQNQVISYGQATMAGITVAIITALIMAVSAFVYCEFINPGYAEYMVNEAHKVMIANGESPKQIADHLVDERRQFSTGMQVMMALVGQSVVGTILSLIMAIFIKSKKK
jgi:Protein of unknown function (DUF4199)